MKQVLIKAGAVQVADVPSPEVGTKNILVRVSNSCISSGTELAGVRMSALPLYRRALKQPENVAKVLAMVRDQGLKRTIDRVQGKLSAGSPTGYSAAGIVVAVGAQVSAFTVGERVACAGAGIANHAEFIDVPVNLAVAVPTTLDLSMASTVTLGAIALQGVRRAAPTLGESFLVIGLGILGQITVQLLAAQGCRVIGVDTDAQRVATARKNGMDFGLVPSEADTVERVLKLTDGMGADGVIITAATSSNSVIHEAMNATRRKGRVVLVGDVGLDLKREDFYKKELDFLISCSYGPGRYDPLYEEGGADYPLPYVRWTENRNMAAYLDLLASGKVRLAGLGGTSFPIDQAKNAYDALQGIGIEGEKPLYALLDYPQRKGDDNRIVSYLNDGKAKGKGKSSDIIQVALVGASSFALGVHLPNMAKMKDRLALRAVMSRTGTNARAVAMQYEADYCTTDFDEVLNDQAIDLVLIANRHNLHGAMTLKALKAGKAVFVEKPLAITAAELDSIEGFYSSKKGDKPLLMVGYNRRFAPAVVTVRDWLSDRTTPLMMNYRMNGGYIAPDHWIQGEEGGGRNLGEACHIYDLFSYLTNDSEVISVEAAAITPASPNWLRNDNFSATIRYSDGSVASLIYCAMGHGSCPKERLEVIADGKNIVMDDFRSVTQFASRSKTRSWKIVDKGQYHELAAVAAAMERGDQCVIPLKSLFATSRVALEVEALIRQG